MPPKPAPWSPASWQATPGGAMQQPCYPNAEALPRVDFFTSHEALLLLYEQAQTRQVPRREGWYNLSTHFPWIGMRTALPESAHVEYARGIRNPIAIKIGAPANGITSSDLAAMQEH